MSESFDPYHKLLGISKRDQPPTLYRLLGLEALESDREVIDAAANKQMAYLQGCSNGDHAASAERLINEVASARLRLLNPESKAQYDGQLQASVLETQPVPTDSVVQPSPVTVPLIPEPIHAAPVVVTSTYKSTRTARQRRSSGVLWVVGTIMSCTLIWGAWVIGFLGGTDAVLQESRTTANSRADREKLPPDPSTDQYRESPQAPGSTSNEVMPNLKSMGAMNPIPLSNAAEDASSPLPPQSPSIAAVTAAESERLEGFRSLATAARQPPSTDQSGSGSGNPSSGRPDTPSRLPVPDEEQLDAAMSEVRVTFSSQMKAAKATYEKQHLGKEIVDLALETSSPAARYALLQTALEIFTEAGDFPGSMQVIDQVQGQYAIPEFEHRLRTMQELEPMLYRPLDQTAMADQAEMLIDTAILRDDYTTASELCTICKKLSLDLRNRDMANKFTLKMDEIETLQNKHPTYLLARERLESEPDNAKANEFLGRFLCFGKSQWNEGLPYLKSGEDADLRELAAADLRLTSTATEIERVADRWWEYSVAAEEQILVGRASRQRAIDLYRRAIAHGLSGLDKAAAEKRVQALPDDSGSAFAISRTSNAEQGEPKRPRGVPPAAIYFNGNWYLFSDQPVKQPEAIAIAQRAGGRPVVVRSAAENDFLVAHGKGTLMLGMIRRDGVWYDALNEPQHFFLWDVRNRQPDTLPNETWAAIDEATSLWHNYNIRRMNFVIEWGRE